MDPLICQQSPIESYSLREPLTWDSTRQVELFLAGGLPSEEQATYAESFPIPKLCRQSHYNLMLGNGLVESSLAERLTTEKLTRRG